MELSNIEWWVVLGVAMLVIEIFAVSFFFLFLGIGALITAILSYYGVISGSTQEILTFAVTSIGSLFLFRKQLKEMFFRQGEEYSELIAEQVTVSKDIPEKGEGKVFYRGADWIAKSEMNQTFKKGEVVTIIKVDGIKLIVE